MQKKLTVLFAFAIVVLVVGWAITPAQAHNCPDHHHCGNGDPPPPPPPGDADPAVVYDASFKVRSHVTRSIFVVNSDGTNRLLVIEGTKELSYRDASWSPDGKGLVFRVQPTMGTDNPSLDPGFYTIRMEEDGNGEWTGQWDPPVFVGPVGDLNPVGVSGDFITIENPAWHPDGLLIAYSDKQPGTTPDNRDILLVNADGSNSAAPVKLTDTQNLIELYPTWSPDGDQFAVEEYHDVNSHLVVYDFDDNSFTGVESQRLIFGLHAHDKFGMIDVRIPVPLPTVDDIVPGSLIGRDRIVDVPLNESAEFSESTNPPASASFKLPLGCHILEVNLQHQGCIHVAVCQDRDPEIPSEPQVCYGQGQAHEGGLNDPDRSPGEVGEPEDDGADRHCGLGPKTQLCRPRDQERPVDHFLPEGRDHVDACQRQQEHR